MNECYRCIHRDTIPGNAHSACRHPATEPLHASPLSALIEIRGHMPPAVPCEGITIQGDPHGIRNGWFAWPFNFDPVWLRVCSGFTPRDEE